MIRPSLHLQVFTLYVQQLWYLLYQCQLIKQDQLRHYGCTSTRLMIGAV